jgi:hypothetical protein
MEALTTYMIFFEGRHACTNRKVVSFHGYATGRNELMEILHENFDEDDSVIVFDASHKIDISNLWGDEYGS